MLDYPALTAVAAVSREGSFERAAALLNITPSAVSQRVRGLEERLGAILIHRGQPCTATDLGRSLCAHLNQVRMLEADLIPHLGLPRTGTEQPLTLKLAVNADSLATWFPPAAAQFGKQTGHLLDLTLDDEGHTAKRLKSGDVVAAVTSDPEPVQGCKTLFLGRLVYAACASPDFMTRFFSSGINHDSLSAAPQLRFDRRDHLQTRWMEQSFGQAVTSPAYWVPSTHGFLDLCLAGLAWGMHPLFLAAPALADGRLYELCPGQRLEVALYWTATRLHAASLRHLTDAVLAAARDHLPQ